MFNSEQQSFTGWVLAGVASIIATLSSTLGAFAYKVIGDYREEIKELKQHAKECESKHFELNGKYSAIERELCYLRNEVKQIDKNGTEFGRKGVGE